MIADYAHAARLQARYEDNGPPVDCEISRRVTASLYGPGVTPAMRGLVFAKSDLERHERLLERETEVCRATPTRWEISRVKARITMREEARQLVARLEARIAAEAQQVAA